MFRRMYAGPLYGLRCHMALSNFVVFGSLCGWLVSRKGLGRCHWLFFLSLPQPLLFSLCASSLKRCEVKSSGHGP